MKLKELYRFAVEKGIQADPRGRDQVMKDLDRRRKKFDELKEEEKNRFDVEKLTNPYDDTRILWGDPDTEVNSLLVGIDIDSAELVLADRLRQRGRNFDLVLGHHPQGKALAGLYGVMDVQEDILFNMGVPINVAQGLMIPRIAQVERNLLPDNHNKAVDAARLLNIPFMCVHTPADNNVVHYLERLFEEKDPETVGDIMDILREIPEYATAINLNAGPKIILGDEERRCGKILVDMTGGTDGSEEVY